MELGPAGYGRYDSDPARVGCPWARSRWSPCIAREARLALDGDACRGCGHDPEYLIMNLAEEYEPARALLPVGEPVTAADEFAAMVREATEPGEEELWRAAGST